MLCRRMWLGVGRRRRRVLWNRFIGCNALCAIYLNEDTIE
jgi:hypothetical protein